ncbi:hypothetical protein HED60_19465 [Planctomycetales bacterium ZRK34]|nr:hypothetical protein HED60_19465 [Planctomycetales bacterium ZRK34]
MATTLPIHGYAATASAKHKTWKPKLNRWMSYPAAFFKFWDEADEFFSDWDNVGAAFYRQLGKIVYGEMERAFPNGPNVEIANFIYLPDTYYEIGLHTTDGYRFVKIIGKHQPGRADCDSYSEFRIIIKRTTLEWLTEHFNALEAL